MNQPMNDIYLKELEREYETLQEDYNTIIEILVERDAEIARLRSMIELLKKELVKS